MNRAAGGTLDQLVTLVLVDDAGETASDAVDGWIRFIAESGTQLDWHFEAASPLVANQPSMSGSSTPTYARGAVHAYVDDVLYAWHELPRLMTVGETLTLPGTGGQP
jgi:hypothetical protein